VHAFEPLPRNLHFLRRHLALNRISNVQLNEGAVSDIAGRVRMAEGDSPSEFHVDPQGEWEIQATTLDDWRVRTQAPPPDLVKIDVEGSEAAVLRGGFRTFAEVQPAIYLALHGDTQRRECRQLLDRWGYRVTALERGLTPEVSSEWLAEGE
jgi:FkbM family methyltransferase